ncbi:amino acid permease/ SLC12A domain-containing protein [Usnea florida]
MNAPNEISPKSMPQDKFPSPPMSEFKDVGHGDNGLEATTGDRSVVADRLARKLSARQVQMIAIGGTIGTGLFLGTGKSLATGGPASMLIAYALVGVIVFITMLSLGEMAAFVPIAGSFCTFAGRFVDDAFGFALTWNYWFNDAVSMASDLVALQLILQYWTTKFPGWGLSLIFWALLILANIATVRIYGELEYWLSLLKIFILLGIAVNCGGNTAHRYIGGHNWFIGDAPFVGGIGGFASVFVTAAFAYGGTESIAITAGETKDPARTMPKVVRNVFWRILLFYLLSVLILGLNVPYTTPDLDSKDTRTSPFTLVFQMAGSTAAGSFINAVIMTSVLSAGNHALFAGTRLLYTLAVDKHAPAFFSALNRNQVPWIAVLATSAISILCFGASFIGAGQLWTWLQNIVGVSNQLSWIAIGIASLRFRAAIKAQSKEHLLPFKNWTYPWGPWFSVILNSFLVLVQGWSSFSPSFSAVTFVSLYVELPIMLVMYLGWKVLKRTKVVRLLEMDLETDTYPVKMPDSSSEAGKSAWRDRAYSIWRWLL